MYLCSYLVHRWPEAHSPSFQDLFTALHLDKWGAQTIFDAFGEQFIYDMRSDSEGQWLRAVNGRVNELVHHQLTGKHLTSYTEVFSPGSTYYRYAQVRVIQFITRILFPSISTRVCIAISRCSACQISSNVFLIQ